MRHGLVAEAASAAAAELWWSRGREKLVVFSLVEEVEREQGERALLRALEVCRLHSQVWAVSKRVRVSLLVYLEAREQLKVVERTTWYQELKHCATAKFSTTRKLRKMKAEDRELARYAI